MAAPKPQPAPTNLSATAPRKVKLAFLHQSVSIPGGFNTEKTLSAQKIPGLVMAWHPEGGLLVWHKNQEAIIPEPNVAIAVFDLSEVE